ncbi:MAG: rhamnogalacturonan acetylesterase [Clostridiales bacterium]|nr:rhamnogalacturonan acetylesterase [Clostridiales bacterium]
MIKYENEPLKLEFHVPNGTYEVNVTVHADEDTEFSVYSQSRRFMARNIKISAGSSMDIIGAVSVCDRSFFDEAPKSYDGIEIYIDCDGAVRATAAISPADIPVIYICGDSTVTDQPAAVPYIPQSTYCGWGQMLPQYLDAGIAAENQAQSGSCTSVFIENNWEAFKDKIKKGDVLMVQFGHNDQKVKDLDPFGGYSENLRYFVNYARERGAYPILISPINRIIFEPNGSLKNLLGDYRNAVKGVCDELNVPFIDLWTKSTDYFEKAGCVKAWDFFFGDEQGRDYTHTNDIGGDLAAKLVLQEILDKQIEPVRAHIKADKIKIEQVYADPGDSADMTEQIEHLKSIGLVNTPEALSDLDADIKIP